MGVLRVCDVVMSATQRLDNYFQLLFGVLRPLHYLAPLFDLGFMSGQNSFVLSNTYDGPL